MRDKEKEFVGQKDGDEKIIKEDRERWKKSDAGIVNIVVSFWRTSLGET